MDIREFYSPEIEVDEYVKEKRVKPSQEAIEALREQKKRILENKKEFISYDSPEYEIGRLLSLRQREKNYKLKIEKVILLIRELQIKRNYLYISRSYLKNIIKDYSNLKRATREKVLTNIIQKAKEEQIKVFVKKKLAGDYHQEKLFNGERTKSKIKPVDKLIKNRHQLIKSYSFI